MYKIGRLYNEKKGLTIAHIKKYFCTDPDGSSVTIKSLWSWGPRPPAIGRCWGDLARSMYGNKHWTS